MGDFNTDFSKNNSHSTTLTKLLIKQEMTAADLIFPQQIGYTYSSHYGKTMVTSWIDHCIVGKQNIPSCKCVRIINSNCNLSDHKPITIDYELKTDSSFGRTKQTVMEKSQNIDLSNQVIRWEFTKLVDMEIPKLKHLREQLSNEINRSKIKIIATQLFNSISSILINASEKTKEIINNSKKKKKKINIVK